MLLRHAILCVNKPRSIVPANRRLADYNLLVSHWEVDTDAAVTLITSTVSAIGRNAKIGRSEGLRRAMLEMIDNGEPEQAHPSYWAPFVLVGEGAAAR